ncbi:MAG: amidohydrolase family protein [Luteibaculaceae bacterium]
MLKIDTHSHIIPEHLPSWAEKFGYDGFIHLDHHKPGFARMMQGNKFFREIKSNCWDLEQRIEEYNQYQTQVQVICTIPVLFSYHANAEDGYDIARFLNDNIAEAQHKYPKNYIALGTIPMQDPELSVKELERLKKELNIKGIQIGSNINNKNLNEPEFIPIFSACEKLDIAILVHPWNMMGTKHMEKYWLPWLVGMPAETTRAACSLIFGGIFNKFPKLRVMFAHSGGNLFGTIGRIEHGFNCRPDLVAIDNPFNPKEYLNRFWVDSITHDPLMLKFIIENYGYDKICLGSDYPFPLGDLEIGAMIEEMQLNPKITEHLMHKNALNWLNLNEADFI